MTCRQYIWLAHNIFLPTQWGEEILLLPSGWSGINVNEYVANIMLILLVLQYCWCFIICSTSLCWSCWCFIIPEYRGGEQGQGEVLEARPVRGETMEQQCCPLPLSHLLPGLRNSFSARKENMMLDYHLLCDQLKMHWPPKVMFTKKKLISQGTAMSCSDSVARQAKN